MLTLLLAGFQGVGKTTAGRLLAETLQLPFFDTDEMLAAHHNKPVRQLYQELMEEQFREEEAKMLVELKSKDMKSVVALGGGTLLSPKAQELAPYMGSLVYLYSSPEVLMQKLQPASFLDPKDPGHAFKAIFAKRHPLFCQLCTYRIDIDGMSAQEVANTILRFYG